MAPKLGKTPIFSLEIPRIPAVMEEFVRVLSTISPKLGQVVKQRPMPTADAVVYTLSRCCLEMRHDSFTVITVSLFVGDACIRVFEGN